MNDGISENLRTGQAPVAPKAQVAEGLGHTGLIDEIPEAIRGDLPKTEVKEPNRDVVRTGARAAFDTQGNIVKIGPNGESLGIYTQAHNVTPEIRDSILRQGTKQ